MHLTRPRLLSVTVVAGLLLGACGDDDAAPPLPVRAIKHMTVAERATDQLRRIAGLVQAGTTTDIAFEIPGRVTALPVGIGDSITRGTQIGRLETERYELQLESAKSELQNIQAQRRDAEKKFTQQKKLYDKGYATKTAFDSAQATLEGSRSQVETARSKVAITRRDVQKTILLAPFNGRVSAKYVEVFTEVSAGQKILQVHSEGDLKVTASVPDAILQNIAVGDEVDVRFTSLGGDPKLRRKPVKGTITEVGSQATAANAFQVTAKLDEQAAGVRPGMSAEVTFRFETAATGKAFLLPKSAVQPGGGDQKGFVYAFDKAAGVVRKRTVSIVNIRNNDLEVIGAVKPGDVIATAGVSFLSDGMAVRLMAAPEN